MKKELLIVSLCGFITGLSLVGSYWFVSTQVQTVIKQQKLADSFHAKELNALRKQILELDISSKSTALNTTEEKPLYSTDNKLITQVLTEIKELKLAYGNLNALFNDELNANQQQTLLEPQLEQGLENLAPPPMVMQATVVKAIEEKFQTFHSELLAEEIDTQWSVPATQMLESAVNSFAYDQPDVNLLMHDVDCRATLCRFDLAIDGGITKAEEFHMSLLTKLGTQIAGLQRKKELDANGRVRSVYYLKRKS